MVQKPKHVVIVGAGIGGLSSALRLAHAGLRVTVLERHATRGGKMRTVPSAAGPIDAGPTVLTLKPVFEALFADVEERLENYVTLTPIETIARHFWSDGTWLDLHSDAAASRSNISNVFGAKAATAFDQFSTDAKRLFEAFDAPILKAAVPSQKALTFQVMRNPSLIRAMSPHLSLAKSLEKRFANSKLSQLFGRYATYVGGSPYHSPSILSLIWDAEARGVWSVVGGMHMLACAIEDLAMTRGAEFRYNTDVTRIETQKDQVCAVHVGDERIPADVVLFNGDPRALVQGDLGHFAGTAVSASGVEPRSLSALVHTFAAVPAGIDLKQHNVFFADNPKAEFGPLAKGENPKDATLYVHAQDRDRTQPLGVLERFEIILNAPPVQSEDPTSSEEIDQCQTQVFNRLADFGLTFSPKPKRESLTTPQMFGEMFPASNGSLYGLSPHGLMAAFKRPTAQTRVRGLYLVGGGSHPGAGVPMATLSAKHAAEAILSDQISTLMSRQVDTHGGTSMGSVMTG